MKTQHSPGPWKIEPLLNGKPVLSPQTGITIYDNQTPPNPVAICGGNEANARLIAATLELLEALKRIINSSVALPPSMTKQGREAIKKAIEG